MAGPSAAVLVIEAERFEPAVGFLRRSRVVDV